MEERYFGYFRNSNPNLYQFLKERGIEPDDSKTQTKPFSKRVVWFWMCTDELREAVEVFRSL